MELSEKLQQLRKQKNLTQEELAEMLYVSRTAISKWESGSGYPSIDSLKAISQLFSVTIDDLLSAEKLMMLAEHESRAKERNITDMVYGILDCMMLILFFLPIFGQTVSHVIESVPLFSLTGIPRIFQTVYMIIVSLSALIGILILALQNNRQRFWMKGKIIISLLLSILAVLVFTASQQPYAAAFVFFLLLLKGALLIKQR